MLARHPGSPEPVGIDAVPVMLAVARQRIGHMAMLLQASAEELPFDKASFQLVTCSNALNYFLDPDSALREMRRVLAPSGNLVISDWCRDFATMKLLNSVLPWSRYAHVHTFSQRELERKLTRAGFKVIESTERKIDWFWGIMAVQAVAERIENSEA